MFQDGPCISTSSSGLKFLPINPPESTMSRFQLLIMMNHFYSNKYLS